MKWIAMLNSKPATRPAARDAMLVLSLLLPSSSADLTAQMRSPADPISVSAPVLLTGEYKRRPMVEPHIAAHPTNPDHLLAAAMIAVPEAEWEAMRQGIVCAAFLSRDGGLTWRQRELPVTTCYDPWVTFTADGTALFSVLANHPDHAALEEPLLVFRSPDGGETWDERPMSLGRGHDRPMMVADLRSAARRSWVYLVSSRTIRAQNGAPREAVFVARSRNGGRSFDEPRVLTPNNLVLRAETPVVLRDGTLVVPYVEAGYATPGPRAQQSLVRRRSFTMASADGGTTFAAPLFITEACGPPPFATSALVVHRGNPGAAADDAAPEQLTHVCNAAGGGAVLATTSAPDTELWTEPRPVHAPLAEGSTGHIAAVATNAAGVIGVVYTTRFRQAERRCYEVFLTASLDSGATFLPPHRLSAGPYCLDPGLNGATVTSWPDGGDYYGLAADANGRLHVVWPDARSGVVQIYAARVDVGAAASASGRNGPAR